MLKVLKFGGSSLSDSSQFAKVKEIVEYDRAREVVVVSAPGKRKSDDNKITDLLYLIHAHIRYGVAYDTVLTMVRDRFTEIQKECGLKTDIAKVIDETFAKVDKNTSVDFIVSSVGCDRVPIRTKVADDCRIPVFVELPLQFAVGVL